MINDLGKVATIKRLYNIWYEILNWENMVRLVDLDFSENLELGNRVYGGFGFNKDFNVGVPIENYLDTGIHLDKGIHLDLDLDLFFDLYPDLNPSKCPVLYTCNDGEDPPSHLDFLFSLDSDEILNQLLETGTSVEGSLILS